MANAHKKGGFSLIELAIVLVIIGLLSGGVLVGQTLIRNAELQAAINEIAQYKDAIATFQQKYVELPGDMSDATNYWGELDSTNCQDRNALSHTGANGRKTCNGDGDGEIETSNGAQEWFHAWLHLKNAGLIEGQFTGTRNADPRQAFPGVNVPRSAIDDGGYTLLAVNMNNSGGWWNGDYQPTIAMGKPSATMETNAALLKAEEAWNIDTKLDDALPGTGKVRSFRYANCNTSTNVADQATTEYALDSTGNVCALLFSFEDPGF